MNCSACISFCFNLNVKTGAETRTKILSNICLLSLFSFWSHLKQDIPQCFDLFPHLRHRILNIEDNQTDVVSEDTVQGGSPFTVFSQHKQTNTLLC